jgi:hypothetical protein
VKSCSSCRRRKTILQRPKATVRSLENGIAGGPRPRRHGHRRRLLHLHSSQPADAKCSRGLAGLARSPGGCGACPGANRRLAPVRKLTFARALANPGLAAQGKCVSDMTSLETACSIPVKKWAGTLPSTKRSLFVSTRLEPRTIEALLAQRESFPARSYRQRFQVLAKARPSVVLTLSHISRRRNHSLKDQNSTVRRRRQLLGNKCRIHEAKMQAVGQSR